jgi:hypothetical protein
MKGSKLDILNVIFENNEILLNHNRKNGQEKNGAPRKQCVKFENASSYKYESCCKLQAAQISI